MTTSIARSSRWLSCAAAIAAAAATLPASVPSASAADMPAQPRPQAAASPLWTGFYFGLHGGGGWGSSRLRDPNYQVAHQPVTVRSSGPLAGAQMGANWQFGNVVVGAELDASWASIKGDVAPDPNFTFSGFAAKYRALATGTGRVGYAAGSWLGYVKAGVAWADIQFTSITSSPQPVVVEHSRTGMTAGAGLEVAFYRNLSAKLEYNVVYFGEASQAIGAPNGPGDVDHLLHLVKGGINVRFGGDHISARY
jgi:outer membrane immunogenic protein